MRHEMQKSDETCAGSAARLVRHRMRNKHAREKCAAYAGARVAGYCFGTSDLLSRSAQTWPRGPGKEAGNASRHCRAGADRAETARRHSLIVPYSGFATPLCVAAKAAVPLYSDRMPPSIVQRTCRAPGRSSQTCRAGSPEAGAYYSRQDRVAVSVTGERKGASDAQAGRQYVALYSERR